MNRYNLDTIVSVHAVKAERENFISVLPETRNFLGLIKRKGGVYNLFKKYISSVEEFIEKNKNCCYINDQIYTKPYVEVNFLDQSHKIIYFDTYEEALEYVERLSEEHNLKEL